MNNLGYPLQLTKTLRIDRGPRTKVGIATERFLTSGQLADHYRLGGVDAFGKEIVLGQTFNYVDWKSKDDDHIYTLYELRNDETGAPTEVEFERNRDGNEIRVGRYVIVERYDNEADAMSAAELLGA